jgi:antitoxin Phd
MKIDTNNIVSLSESNRNFSRVARLADDAGPVVIMRNNAPSYLLMTFAQAESEQEAPGEDVLNVARRIAAKAKKGLEIATPNNHDKESRCSMRDTEQKISEVNATMAMEGMPLTDEDKNRLRDIFEGRVTVEKTVQELILKHSPRRKTAHERI